MSSEPRYNWVKARAKCNAEEMFKRLRDVVRSDCEEARDAYEDAPVLQGIEYRNDADKHFTVIHQPPEKSRDTRVFRLENKGITVYDGNDKKLFRVVPWLGADDECVFESDDGNHRYRAWEVSRRALEGLFFKD